MEDQGKNSWQASHTAASGTALESSSWGVSSFKAEDDNKIVLSSDFFFLQVLKGKEKSGVMKSNILKNRTAQLTK